MKLCNVDIFAGSWLKPPTQNYKCAGSFTHYIVLAAAVFLALVGSVEAAIVITEVHPNGSSASYAGDWFELTNNGGAAVDITGWKVDDGSNAFGTAIALTGLTMINPGQSAIFIEGTTTHSNNFMTTWFGGIVPGFPIGTYSGSMIGLSSGGDAVNIFDSVGTPIAGVTFGATTLAATLDNAAGLSGAISTASVAGVNGAYTVGPETGSPGQIPEPASVLLLLFGASVMAVSNARSRYWN